MNNKRYLVGCGYQARSFSEARSCQKWAEARSKPCRRWKEVPNSRQNNAGFSIFSERVESPQRVFDAEEAEAAIETHGEGARRVMDAELRQKASCQMRPTLLSPRGVCSPEK